MNVIERAKSILLSPAQTWPVIDAEPATVGSIYKDWLVIMAAIPAVCAFIGRSVIGAGAFGYGFRIPIVYGLESMVVHYIMSLVVMFVMALIVDALAPTFGGTKNQVSALKVVAYGATASFVAGFLSLLPSLGMLGIIAACYSIYLIYLGLPVLMKCPQDKAVGYTAVVIIIGIVAGIVIGAVSTAFTPGRAMLFGGGAGGSTGSNAITINTPDGEATIDTNAMAQRVEAARARMAAAQKSGDPASTGAALGEMMGAITGSGGTPIPVADLKAQLPDALGALKRDSFETSGGQAMGISASVAKATYAGGEQHAQLSISDMGGLGGLASVAAWANMTTPSRRPTRTAAAPCTRNTARTAATPNTR